MNLMDLPYDVLAPIIGKLGFNDQLAFRPLCRRSRDLTAGAALVKRIALAIFIQPHIDMRHVHMIFFPITHPGDLGVVLSWAMHADALEREYLREYRKRGPMKRVPPFPVWEQRAATIHCSGFEDSRRLAVKVNVRFETYVKTADTWRTGKGKWDKDKVQLRFEVTAEGGVDGIAVAVREGFAEKRAAIVGELLAEILKSAAPAAAAASLLNASFENCDDVTRTDVVTRALARL